MGLPDVREHARKETYSAHTAAVQNLDRAVRGVAVNRPHPAPRPHPNPSAQPPEVTPDGAFSCGRCPGALSSESRGRGGGSKGAGQGPGKKAKPKLRRTEPASC